jgi:hypothetical protein
MYKIDNLNQLPYTPPKYYNEICKKKNMELTHCLIDPFYQERLDIYNSVYQRFNKMINNDTTIQSKKKIMKDLLHDTYKNYNKNLGFLPYNYFDTFKANAFKIIFNTSGNNLQKLIDYIDLHVKKDNNYIIDPFYSFITLVDWLIQEMIDDKNVDNKFIISFINNLIDKGYIGFNQYRFYIHVAILRRNKDNQRSCGYNKQQNSSLNCDSIPNFILSLIQLNYKFENDLNQQFRFKDSLQKCLVIDLAKFALINHRYSIFKLLIKKYDINVYQDLPYEFEPLYKSLV